MQYTEKQLTKLLADVEKEFTIHLEKAEENFKLAKSEGESTATGVEQTILAKAEDDSADDKKEDKKDDAKEAPAAESKDEAKEAPAAESEEEVAAAPAEQADAAAPAADGHGYDEEDLAHLNEMYSSMSFEELMAHHDAVKACLDAMAAEQAPAQEAPAPEAPVADVAAAPAAEAAPIDKCGDMQIAKSEGSVEVELVKSELAAQKAKNEELKKTLDAVQEFVTKLASKKAAPAAKAITAVETIAKSEITTEVKQLSKSEITAILNKKSADPKLSKSEREAINSYYGSGQVSIEKISHLLK